jgi:two-component system CheB/CheR fusion protein
VPDYTQHPPYNKQRRTAFRIRDPAERPHRPADILFHSLAEKKRPNVIGVILSGSGSDGAKGIQAIKEAGGVTFAEQENSACFF